MSETLQVRQGLYHLRIGDVRVFLDIIEDRYFQIEGNLEHCFERFLSGRTQPRDHADLRAAGLIEPADIPKLLDDCANEVVRTALKEPPSGAVTARWTARSLIAQARASYHLKRIGLAQTVAASSGRGRRCNDPGQEIVPAVVAGFRATRLLVSGTDRCMVRAIAMKQILNRWRIPSQLVVGISLPFAAHAWVQSGDMILSDRSDIVAPFQPILAVE